jgi:hypothetical protein
MKHQSPSHEKERHGRRGLQEVAVGVDVVEKEVGEVEEKVQAK